MLWALGVLPYVAGDCAGETWEYVKYLDDVSAVNPLPRQSRELLYELYKGLENEGHCLPGTGFLRATASFARFKSQFHRYICHIILHI